MRGASGGLIWKDLSTMATDLGIGEALEGASSHLHPSGPVGGLSAGRGRGQGLSTVITLIFAGQQSRCRMTVSRHRRAASD
jgi:hypothetical protein